ncbi:hypothetical protein [Moritella viscosa]|uniref:hypothetical protein n=1 Tax=Moritella viscosa TaxID=80854 RepID=UPI0005D3630D|nr:hypothetical protein [Moritella viscosa]
MLYILGEEARIAGISGFTVRPPQARQSQLLVRGVAVNLSLNMLLPEKDGTRSVQLKTSNYLKLNRQIYYNLVLQP